MSSTLLVTDRHGWPWTGRRRDGMFPFNLMSLKKAGNERLSQGLRSQGGKLYFYNTILLLM